MVNFGDKEAMSDLHVLQIKLPIQTGSVAKQTHAAVQERTLLLDHSLYNHWLPHLLQMLFGVHVLLVRVARLKRLRARLTAETLLLKDDPRLVQHLLLLVVELL